MARFVSADAVEDDVNPYRYVRNNPVNLVDPGGALPPVLVAILIGALIGASEGALIEGVLAWWNCQAIGAAALWGALWGALIGGLTGGLVHWGGSLIRRAGGWIRGRVSSGKAGLKRAWMRLRSGRTAPPRVAPRGLLHSDPSKLVKSRVDGLTAAIPEGSRGHITMSVGVVEDSNGVRSVLVSTSEPRGYLRPGVTLKPGEKVIAGTGHAEEDIINYAKANNLKVIDIGATRPVCRGCQEVIGPSGANISTSLKKRP